MDPEQFPALSITADMLEGRGLVPQSWDICSRLITTLDWPMAEPHAFTRIEPAMMVTVRTTTGDQHHGHTCDVSLSGAVIQFAAAVALPVGATVVATFIPAGHQADVATMLVVRAVVVAAAGAASPAPAQAYVMHFSEISGEDGFRYLQQLVLHNGAAMTPCKPQWVQRHTLERMDPWWLG